MLNLEQLRMFVESAETGSFSACARKLGKAQSAVSQGIANLEIDLGIEIFDRSTRRATLTAEGRRLLNYARVVLQQTQELEAAAQSITRQEEHKVTLAIETGLQIPAFSQILYEFGQRFPATRIEVLSVASPDVVALIKSAGAELGLMLSDMSFKRDVDLCFIGHIQFCAVCGPEHPLAHMDEIEISQVAGYTQMIMKGTSGGELDQEVAISSMQWSSNNVHCIIDIIMQGNGWGYLPIHLVQQYIESGKLHKMPMRLDDKPWSSPVDMVTRKNYKPGPALSWLSNRLKYLLD